MTARSGRFRLAPVLDGAADWAAATDVVLAPLRLTSPVRVLLTSPPVVLPGRPR